MEKQVIEINGIKMEVDLRTAKRVDQFKVGDPVKLLIVNGGDSEVKAGIIVDFECFESLPTIVVAYVAQSWSYQGLQFAHINAKSKDKYEIVAASTDTMLALDKQEILQKMEREIADTEIKVRDLKAKKHYFIERFGIYFGKVKAETA